MSTARKALQVPHHRKHLNWLALTAMDRHKLVCTWKYWSAVKYDEMHK